VGEVGQTTRVVGSGATRAWLVLASEEGVVGGLG
jgi:hypothetical protein